MPAIVDEELFVQIQAANTTNATSVAALAAFEVTIDNEGDPRTIISRSAMLGFYLIPNKHLRTLSSESGGPGGLAGANFCA